MAKAIEEVKKEYEEKQKNKKKTAKTPKIRTATKTRKIVMIR
jgi:hypothetical protein